MTTTTLSYLREARLEAVLLSALLAGACGSDDKTKPEVTVDAAAPLDAATSPGNSGSVATDASKAGSDAGDAAATSSGCPGDLVCVAPSGRYLCEKPGPEVITCTKNSDCPAGIPMCYALAGQGICLQLCTPPGGFPRETSVSGSIVEYAAGAGMTGATETPTEKLLAGVEVCLVAPAELKTQIGCVTTDATGKFTLAKLPPNRNASMAINGVLSFTKAGYVPQLQSFGLGDGSQTVSNHIRLLTTAYATEIAAKAGGKLPDATTGWLMLTATKFDVGGADGPFTFVQGALRLKLIEDVSVSSAPQAGIGPIYTDAQERVAATTTADGGLADAGASTGDAGAGDSGVADASAGVRLSGKTSISGQGFYLNVPGNDPAAPYQLTFSHPTLNCGTTPIPATAVPGFVFAAVGTACGNGVSN